MTIIMARLFLILRCL